MRGAVSDRVVLHVGLPKTGTTYLQSLLWSHAEVLRDHGVRLPGGHRREHLWASGDVREEPGLARRNAAAPGAWARLAAELRDAPGTGLVTHEFLCGASAEQVGRALGLLGDTEVHVVVTAREIVSLVTARWQERVKNGATGTLDDYPPRPGYDPADEWGWATIDLGGVLERWGAHVPPERIHVICPPAPDEPRDVLWQRFAGVLGIDPGLVPTDAARANESLGLVGVELMRRVNPHVRDLRRPADRGTWLRGYLAQQVLARRGGDERFWPAPARVAELRAMGDAGLERLRTGGYDVLGSIDQLRTPDDPGARRHPDDVTDAELLDAATATIADLLADVRAARADARAALPPGGAVARVRGRLALGRRLRRPG